MWKMKKNYYVIFLFVFFKFFCSCENFSLDGNYSFQEESLLSMMTITGKNINFKYENPPIDKPDLIVQYNIIHINGMPFIELSGKMPMEVAYWKDFEESKYIKTNNLILFLSFLGKNKRMFAFTEGYSFKYTPLTRTRYDEWGSQYKDCSSFLIEKTKSYPVENLRKLVVDTPWVEGVPGDGIGEGFTIECTGKKKPLGPYLFIINGYISYDKPYLYKQNNRIKKIKVIGLKSGREKILDVLDTPHPQTVDISFITEPEDIRVEIAEVYKGSKYDDTCLHYCINFNEEVIPYENSIGD